MLNTGHQLKKWIIYLFYWSGYLLLFSLIQGVPANDFFTAFGNELIGLIPKVIFVTLVVEWLTDDLFLKKNITRFCATYLLLLVTFAFVLRIVDNYIILKYFLTYWRKEPLLSAPPFLYNAIKLQFLVTIPFSVKLLNYWKEEKKRLQHVQTEADHYLDLFNEAKHNLTAGSAGNNNAFINVKCDRRIVKIFFSEICYFEAQGNYIFIYTLTNLFKTYLSVSELEDQLSGTPVVYCFPE
jgi:hypothetical protein